MYNIAIKYIGVSYVAMFAIHVWLWRTIYKLSVRRHPPLPFHWKIKKIKRTRQNYSFQS